MISDNYKIESEFRRSVSVDSISKANYTATASLEVGDQFFIDRDYKISSMPENLKNLTWIKTSNNDKFSTGEEFLSFKVAESVVVYVGHDERISNLPDWIQNWTRTDMLLRDDQNNSYRFYRSSTSNAHRHPVKDQQHSEGIRQ